MRVSLAPFYRIERELGAGGMATVYLAEDLRHPRRVAIKVLRQELAVVLGLDRFQREIKIAAGLAHPHIVPLLDSGEVDGVPWYAMPYFSGDSLRELLEREKQLAIPVALKIAREVAEALAYAHEQGIVHRDIKPENILLGSGSAVVADFGIARAITHSASMERITSTNIPIGTPAYMSPEQSSADRDLDGRSDIYSLGCVVYEMLSGETPFTGPSVHNILARHQVDPVPPLRTVRPIVSPALERAVVRALEKLPADRYATAGEFAEALSRPGVAVTSRAPAVPLARWRSLLRPLPLAAATAAVALVGWFGMRVGSNRLGLLRPTRLDTTRLAVIPVGESGMIALDAPEERLVRDALARWEGVSVSPPYQIRAVAASRGLIGKPVTARDLRDVARDAGAGRYIVLYLTRSPRARAVESKLLDTDNEAVLAENRGRMAASLEHADTVVARITDGLLLRVDTPLARGPPETTRSLPAQQLFLAAQAAIRDWELARADSALAGALRLDAGYSEAAYWLGLTRWWANSETPLWQSDLTQALIDTARLTPHDHAMARAVAMIGVGAVPQACRALGTFAARDDNDFSAWFSWATCLRRDSIVVRDVHGLSGWRFRSSRQQALRAYEHAFLLMPTIHRAIRTDQSLRRVLWTQSNQITTGRAAPPDTTSFTASPAIIGDSLVFVPYPTAAFGSGDWHPPRTTDLAIRRQREIFHSIAVAWAVKFPASMEAAEALATSLELLQVRSCVDTLRRARSLARTADDRLRLAVDEVWLRLKFALPDDTLGIRTARVLADSLLNSASPTAATEDILAGLAILTGRSGPLSRLYRVDSPDAANALDPAATAGALSAYAALGGPADSLAALDTRLARLLHAADRTTRSNIDLYFLSRAMPMALPVYVLHESDSIAVDWAPLQAAQAFARRDTAEVRRILAEDEKNFALVPSTSIDVLFIEAWLASQLGSRDTAAAWLDRILPILPTTPPQGFLDPGWAGGLMRAIALRAELAAGLHENMVARRWARAFAILWSDSDPTFRPILARMLRLSIS